MRCFVYQRKGAAESKTEMEDRAVVCGNILSEGFHFLDDAGYGVYAVMDGVGGLRGSAFASTAVARALVDIREPWKKETLTRALEQVHCSLVHNSSTATTATGVVLGKETNLVFHIGNCRLYGLFDGYLRQLTTDQTRYEDMRRMGLPQEEIPEEAKCVINACLGAKRELLEQLAVTELTADYQQSSRLMLTSDGIHDHISIDDLETFLNGKMSLTSFFDLTSEARANGSEDDMTIVVLEK